MKKSFTLLDSLIDSIAIVDVNGKIIFTNNAWKQFSIENSAEINRTEPGINYLEICEKVTGNELQNATDASIGIHKVISREQSIFEMEYPCHSPEERRWFIMRCSPLTEEAALTIISHINVTKRKLAEENVDQSNNQLEEINKRLNTTVFKIVHDIQGPLNSIEGLINLSIEESSNNTNSTYFSLMEQSISNLKNFVRETLDLSSSTIKIESVNFKTLLNDFYESVKYSDALKLIEIKTDIRQTSEFYTYKTEIISVFSNIISNGLKYSDPKKENPFVTILIDSNEMEAIITITDNGIGIAKEVISKIFDLNFQVSKRSNGGFGIGLNLVKKAIESMKGSIQVFSEFGIGTTFKITIPNLKELINQPL